MNTTKIVLRYEKLKKGERCPDAQEFERESASGGFSERFGAILAKCEPKKEKNDRRGKTKGEKYRFRHAE